MNNDSNLTPDIADSTDPNNAPRFDRHIVPAETAARMEREGSNFRHIPTQEDEAGALTDDQTDRGSIDVTGGYTVDKEGLANNYAIEPEMYVNEPGDLRQQEEEEAAQRREQVASLQDDEQGKLTMDRDTRGRGPGII
jgi:hypothetical protein